MLNVNVCTHMHAFEQVYGPTDFFQIVNFCVQDAETNLQTNLHTIIAKLKQSNVWQSFLSGCPAFIIINSGLLRRRN